MGQAWSSGTYAENGRFVADLGMPVVEWLNPQAGERILDLGCGDGALTLKLKALGGYSGRRAGAKTRGKICGRVRRIGQCFSDRNGSPCCFKATRD